MPDLEDRFSVVITPTGWKLTASAALTVRESAQLAGVTLPSSCRNGTCRTCMCRLTSGRISYKIEWPGLSVDEKREGYILPCVAYPESDLVIEAPAASIASREK